MKSTVAGCLVAALLVAVSSGAATLTVRSAADAGGSCPGAGCTLRQAIATALSGDTINFAPGIATIALTSDQLLISKNLTISGPGAGLLTVQRSAAGGTPNFRIFDVNAVNFTLSGMTIANGRPTASSGGGIRSLGTLTINNVTIRGNHSDSFGGGISIVNGVLTSANSTVSGNSAGDSGGGIYADAGLTVNVSNSTLSGNSAVNAGGGFYNAGTATFTNDTISGNSAGGDGGGLVAPTGSGGLTIANSTIAANSSGGFGGGMFIGNAAVSMRNSIIATNTAITFGPDFFGGVTSQGYNLIGNNNGTAIGGTLTGNQTGTAASPIDPLLGPLQDNGGPTFTRALLSGSPAIEAGHSSGAITDQRGFARPVDSPAIGNASGGDGGDIGAYEVQADVLPGCSTINRIVNNNNDSGADSLRAVIASVCSGSTITFAANVRGAINLTSGELLLNKSLTISGPGANLLSVQRSSAAGTPAFRVFNTNFTGTVVNVSGLTIANGSGGNGGAFYNAARLTVSFCTISGNNENGAIGGGFYNTGGTLTIANSTVSGNSAGSGGGVYNENNIANMTAGTLIINNSTVSGNSGGGIVGTGTATITNSTISGNVAAFGGGGGITNGGNAIISVRNTIIALNTGTGSPDVQGPLNSQGFNIVGNFSGATITPAQLTDQLGVSAAQLNLGPLQDNGGPTRTLALLSGSFAIDKGNTGAAATDQRGFARPVDVAAIANVAGGDGGDIGAFEFSDVRIDIDGNSSYDALTDGLLIMRYLSGLTGTSLTSNVIGGGATRIASSDIVQFLDGIRSALDVDGNGESDGLTDGLMLIRYLFGLRGPALTAGAIGTNPTRNGAQIETYIQSLMP